METIRGRDDSTVRLEGNTEVTSSFLEGIPNCALHAEIIPM